jgi:hypothetical protein
MTPRRRIALLIVILLLAGWRFQAWSHMIQMMMPADSRPTVISFSVESISADGFRDMASELMTLAVAMDQDFRHVEYFRDANILAYEGPSTCLGCHSDATYHGLDGTEHSENLMDNVTGSAHYRFFTTDHDNVWGFNGKLADNFAMGKINRPCPKPGSFAMTAWAERVVTARGDTMSEGCGQCHIGGQPQAPLGEMMPLYSTLPNEKDAIDCLICHAAVYDMNRKQVVDTDDGRLYWGQDRSMLAAMSTVAPTSQACLRCHQHNFGGDLYVDEADPSFSPSILATGTNRPRVMHPGSKRGTPFTPTWDVHAAAGVSCLECHASEGHRIARGQHTTTLMANDLPGHDVACLNCHELPLHTNPEYDDHVDVIACTTCHIPSLHEDNATRRDFAETEFEDGPGIHVYHDIEKLTAPGQGIAYVWWTGDATFLGNPIGDNPNGENLYRFYDAANVWPEYEDYDYAGWYERVMRPIAQSKPSKLYAMKRFNGRQHIDLQNMGPFGGMFVPYNLPLYYRDGNPDAAARAEMDKSMMGMMYGWMFKYYMLDRFMSLMDIDTWNTAAYEDVRAGRKVEPRWIPTDAMLEISHGVRLEGALECANCHGPNGVLDWAALGYLEAPDVDLDGVD